MDGTGRRGSHLIAAIWIVAVCAASAVAQDPGSPSADAARLLQEGKLAEALAAYDKAIEQDPANPELHLGRGRALTGLGRPADALAAFDRAVELDGQNADAHAARAGALMALRRPTEALTAIDRAIELRPDHGPTHAQRAMLMEGLGRAAEALAGMEKAIQLAPDDAMVQCQWAFLLQRRGRNDEALKAFDRAIELNPTLVLAHANRAGLLVQMRRYAAAAEGYGRAVALQPKNAGLHFQHGVALSWSRKPKEGLAALDRALELGAPAGQTNFYRAGALNSLGRNDEALKACDAAEAGLPANAKPQIMLTRAYAFVGLGRFEEALKALDAAPTQGPATTQVKILRVRALMGLRKFDKAKNECDFLLLIYADNANYHVLFSEVIAASEGTPAALEKFVKTVEKFPEEHEILRRHAQLLLGAGKPAEALATIEKSLAQNANCHICAHVKTDALEALGRLEDVKTWVAPWVERQPTCGNCRTSLAFAYALLGGFDEGMKILEGAEIHPSWANYARSVFLRLQGKYREALELAKKNYDQFKGGQSSNYVRCLRAVGENDLAKEIAEKHSKEEPLPNARLVYAYFRAVAGDAAGAEKALAAIEGTWSMGNAFFRSRIHGVLGQPDQVIVWLTKAVDLGFRRPANAAPEPDFAEASKDPRWKALEAKMQRAVEPK